MTDRHDEFIKRIDQQREERGRQDAALAEAVAQAKSHPHPPVLTFFNRDRQRVAVVILLDARFNIYEFRQCGPTGHLSAKPEKLAEELRAEGFIPVVEPLAGRTLEAWTGTTEWALGLKQTHFLSFWNTFSAMGRFDLCALIDKAGSLDAGLKLAGRLLRKELPHVSLF